jgi:hypothetical protein
MLVAENVGQQITVVSVVDMKKASGLLAVNRIESQVVVIIQIFIAEREAIESLCDEPVVTFRALKPRNSKVDSKACNFKKIKLW